MSKTTLLVCSVSSSLPVWRTSRSGCMAGSNAVLSTKPWISGTNFIMVYFGKSLLACFLFSCTARRASSSKLGRELLLPSHDRFVMSFRSIIIIIMLLLFFTVDLIAQLTGSKLIQGIFWRQQEQWKILEKKSSFIDADERDKHFRDGTDSLRGLFHSALVQVVIFVSKHWNEQDRRELENGPRSSGHRIGDRNYPLNNNTICEDCKPKTLIYQLFTPPMTNSMTLQLITKRQSNTMDEYELSI